MADFQQKINQCMIRDRHRLRRQWRRCRAGCPADGNASAKLAQAVERSLRIADQRRAAMPQLDWPDPLPIVQHRDAIAAMIRDHQISVICGETGSGKTTQLPKICLSLGLGVYGMIGHTQPRRLAARSVAQRIAEELHCPLGGVVGYKMRFADKVAGNTMVKLMTDGILLNETQRDPFCDQYDTLIIDEAHERSLNIDFLLGYLKRLSRRRRDLKIIITSATIDPRRFAEHFDDAPIMEVSGRTYPVEVRYRPMVATDDSTQDPAAGDLPEAIGQAVIELSANGPGDMLVFLPGERDILETASYLRDLQLPQTEILPLFARLSNADQQRIFARHVGRRIVLSTNIAETSLTVPGIRYVIDSGLARISRFSARSGVQRLPVEAISQASADQRKGRCGRVGPGICVRLFSEDDFANRPAFTDPEIQRSNLASVLLQMKSLRLGSIADFPFIDPPNRSFVRAAEKTLIELGALDDRGALSGIGRQLAVMPIDPRLGRMIIAGAQAGALDEVLVIASALAVQDVRERPAEKAQAADQSHRQWMAEQSDFLTYLNLWRALHEKQRELSHSKMRRFCRDHYLNFMRFREWQDVDRQLRDIAEEAGLATNSRPAGLDAIHQALLHGLLLHVACRNERGEYLSGSGRVCQIFPGSALFKKKPAWIVAGELVETSRLYARCVASIDPDWLIDIAGHLIRRQYQPPFWDAASGYVRSYETVTLFGLTIASRRAVHYGRIDPSEARRIFIHEALVQGDYQSAGKFQQHNARLIEQVRSLEARERRADVMVEHARLFDFYDQRLPKEVCNGPGFEKWRRQIEKHHPRLLYMTEQTVMAPDSVTPDRAAYPEQLVFGDLVLPLDYAFEPGAKHDGVQVDIPIEAVNQIAEHQLDWLVPGLLDQKIEALVRSLPKSTRRLLHPIEACLAAIRPKLSRAGGPLLEQLSVAVSEQSGLQISPNDFQVYRLPDHLRMYVRVIGAAGRVVAEGRNWAQLRKQLGRQAACRFAEHVQDSYARTGLVDWVFDDLPEHVQVDRAGIPVVGYPTLVDRGDSVDLTLLDDRRRSALVHDAGVRRLFELSCRREIHCQIDSAIDLDCLKLQMVDLGDRGSLLADLAVAVAGRAFVDDRPAVRRGEEYHHRLEAGRRELADHARQLSAVAMAIGSQYHRVQLKLGALSDPAYHRVREDIQGQLGWLVFKGMFGRTPFVSLYEIPRYLQAVSLRQDKLVDGNIRRDLEQLQVLAPLWRQCRQRIGEHHQRGIFDPELRRYRWMLEEMRISLFAQEIGTQGSISAKRLARQWEKVRP